MLALLALFIFPRRLLRQRTGSTTPRRRTTTAHKAKVVNVYAALKNRIAFEPLAISWYVPKANVQQSAWINEIHRIILCVIIAMETLRISDIDAPIVRIRTGPPTTQVLIFSEPGMIQACRIIALRQAILLPVRVRRVIALIR